MGPCRQQIDRVDKIRATLQSNKYTFNENVYAVNNLEQPLLGDTEGASLKLISKVNDIESVKSPVDNNLSKQSKDAYLADNEQAANSSAYKAKMVTEYPKLFRGLGEIQGEYQIKLRDNAQPFALHSPRKVPLPVLGKTKAEIFRVLTMNVISRVDEPTDWRAPMVVTPKAGGEVRICVDLTKLNQSILREAHPLPSFDFTLGKLGGSKVFFKINANSAFWQRKLFDDSCLLTTVITPWGRFCFSRLPYGISTGSEQLQKCISDILERIEGAECQVDHIIVHECDQVKHDERFHVVLKRLAEANVTLNLAKCEFSVTKVKVLSHVVSTEGISADPQNTEAIRNLPAPKK